MYMIPYDRSELEDQGEEWQAQRWKLNMELGDQCMSETCHWMPEYTTLCEWSVRSVILLTPNKVLVIMAVLHLQDFHNQKERNRGYMYRNSFKLIQTYFVFHFFLSIYHFSSTRCPLFYTCAIFLNRFYSLLLLCCFLEVQLFSLCAFLYVQFFSLRGFLSVMVMASLSLFFF